MPMEKLQSLAYLKGKFLWEVANSRVPMLLLDNNEKRQKLREKPEWSLSKCYYFYKLIQIRLKFSRIEFLIPNLKAAVRICQEKVVVLYFIKTLQNSSS